MFREFDKRFIAVAAATFLTSLAVGAFAVTALHQDSDAHAEGVHASWVSDATSVSDHVMEADLVVRVQAVERAESRHLWHPMPDGVKPVRGQGTFAFTDTQVEVLEVYYGDARVGDRLWTMQTGADLLTHEGRVARLEIAEDPLYEIGEEMVLFLVDISGDSVHAADRQLFRTTNPTGRFGVFGGLVDRVGEKSLDLDLAGLEAQIADAVERRAAIER